MAINQAAVKVNARQFTINAYRPAINIAIDKEQPATKMSSARLTVESLV